MHSDSARFMDVFAAQCFEWGVVFFMIGFSPLFVNKGEAGETISLLRKNFDLWGSLLLSFFLVSFPASNEGAKMCIRDSLDVCLFIINRHDNGKLNICVHRTGLSWFGKMGDAAPFCQLWTKTELKFNASSMTASMSR